MRNLSLKGSFAGLRLSFELCCICRDLSHEGLVSRPEVGVNEDSMRILKGLE